MKRIICFFLGHDSVLTEVDTLRAGTGGHLGEWFYSVGHCKRCGVAWDWRDAHEFYLQERERGGDR